MPAASPAVERFWAKVQTGDGCWLWTAGVNAYGYGVLHVDGGPMLAHRFAYALLVGPVPEGLTLDHLCRVRRCVRPEHLEPVTLQQNKDRGKAAITHCPKGHEYTEENTMRRASGRECRACRRAANNARAARRRAAASE